MQSNELNRNRRYGQVLRGILSVCAVLWAGMGWAQSLTPEWAVQGRGTSEDWGLAAGVAGNGATYTAAQFSGAVTLGAGEVNEVELTDADSGLDAYIAFYSADGTFQSAAQIVLGNNFGIKKAVFDEAMNLYLVGQVIGSATFGDGQAGETTIVSQGTADGFVAKYSVDGEFLWVRQVGGAYADQLIAVAVNTTGQVVVGGELDQLDGTTHGVVRVYQPDGTMIWTDQMDPESGYSFHSAGAVSIDSAGRTAVISHQRPSAGLLTDESVSLASYDASGSRVWTAVLAGHLPGAIDASGDGFVAATRRVPAYSVGQTPTEDIVLQKVDAEGSTLWSHELGGSGTDRPTSVEVDEDGYIFLAGFFQNTVTFGQGLDNSIDLVSVGTHDPFIAKYNASGSFYWAHRVGDNDGEQHYALAVNGDDLALSGSFITNLTVGATTLSVAGSIDPFLARFSAAQDPLITGVTFFYPSHVMITGVNMAFSDLGTIETDSNGFYTQQVPRGWSGTVTPSLLGYDFGDTSHTYVNVTEDQVTRDFWVEQDAQVVISGRAAFSPADTSMQGVTIRFSTGETTVTNADGEYSMTLDYHWSGTVTALLDGYTFDPAERSYDRANRHFVDQDFLVHSDPQVTLSGRIYFSPGGEPIEHAVISASGTSATATTDASGAYAIVLPYDYSGQVSATLEGYDFDPSFRPYAHLTTNPVNQDFWVGGQPTIHITGHVLGLSGQGVEGATVSDGQGTAVTTDADGYYTVEVNYAWSGTLTPSTPDNQLFEPASREFTLLAGDQPDQDFQSQGPAQVQIAGVIAKTDGTPVADAVLNYGETLSVQSNAEGAYTLTVDNGWSGTVSITKDDFIFNPISRSYTTLDTHQVAQHYELLGPAHVQISGRALDQSGIGIEAVRVIASNPPDTTYSDSDGMYTVSVPFDWTGAVTVFKEGHTFTPDSRSYDHIRDHRIDQDFNLAGTPMFDISGTVLMHSGGPAAQVMLIVGDHLDTAYTDLSGSYSFQVPLGWTGDVTPEYSDWLFTPSQISYDDVAQHFTDQDYTALGPATLTLSGRVYFQPGNEAIEDVVLKWGVPGDSVITGEDGLYTITVANGWSGTLIPTKQNYDFDPSSRSFNTLRDHQPNQDFWLQGKPVLTISGRIVDRDDQAVPGAIVDYNTADSVLTDIYGDYAITVPYAWSGTVAPRNGSRLHTPTSRAYAVLKTDMAAQNYQDLGPTLPVISGRLYYHPSSDPIEGAIVRYGTDGDSVFTDANGAYSFSVTNDWSGTVTPEKAGHRFDPSFRPYSHVVDHQSGQDFWVNAPSMVSISGKTLNFSGEPEADVILKYSATDSVFSDENGDYLILVSYGWSGTVEARKGQWYIEPASREYSVLIDAVSDQDYALLGPAEVQISGQILDAASAAVGGAILYYGAAGDSVITDVEGNYSFIVGYGWSGDLRPVKTGLAFSPPQRSLNNVTEHLSGVSFMAFPETSPRCLIVAQSAQPNLAAILGEMNYYYHYENNLPPDLITYDLVIYADASAAAPGQLPILPSYLEAGGAVLMMDDAPEALTGIPGDLSSIAAWFGASSLLKLTEGSAGVSVDHPFESTLSAGDGVASIAAGDSAWAAAAWSEDAIVLSQWDVDENPLQAFIRVHGLGKVAYWSHLEPADVEAKTLFTALVEWTLDENTAVDDAENLSALPHGFELLPAYPNPFNPSTTLTVKLAEAMQVKVEVFDIRGRLITVLEDAMMPSGVHRLEWLARDSFDLPVASGMYIIRLRAGSKVVHQKVILLK